MSSSLTQPNKNSASLTLSGKDTGLTWDQATFTWDDAQGTWDNPGNPIIEPSKNSVSISLTSKT